MRRVVALVAVLLGLLAGPVTAATSKPAAMPTTTTITFTGHVSSGRDNAGYFGPWGSNLAGKAFSATYQVVTFANSSVGAGMDIIGIGGNGLPAPTTMSFSLTINGQTRTGTANTLGSAETEDGVRGAFAAGFDRVQTAAIQTTVFPTVTRTFDLSATVQSSLHNLVSDTLSLNAIPSLVYNTSAGDLATGRFQISQSPGTPSVLSYGLLSIDRVSIVSTPELMPAVPEPGEWAMLMAGMAIVGAAARRRR